MKQKYLMIWCMMFFISICTISCNETTSIGLDIIDDENLLNTSIIDTFTIDVATVQTDSINSSDRTRPYLFGVVNDPTFGEARASIYTEFLLRARNPNLGNKPVFDSLVITLAYDNLLIYGNSVSNNSLTVHELEQELDASQTYYSNEKIAYNPRVIGEKRNFQYEPADSNLIVTEIDTSGIPLRNRVAPHLRIRLSDELGNRLLNQIGDIAFQNDENFQQFFKGVYILPASSNNALTYFDILSEQTKMTLYYTNNDGDLGTLDFMMNLSTAVINHFEHDYTNTSIEAVLNQTPNSEAITAYVQAMTGLDIDLKIPTLSKSVLGNISINKAELEVYQVETDGDALFAAPLALGLIAENTEDNTIVVMSSTATGLRRDTLTVNGEMGVKYKVDIDLQRLQNFLENPENQKFSLLPSNPLTSPNRMAVGGPKHPNFPMKLRLIYTSIVE